MYYTYVPLSESDGRFYTGATTDLRKRVELHTAGHVQSTAYRRPLKLVYYEVRTPVRTEDAYRRERFLKTGKGGGYLKKRLGPFPGTDLTASVRPKGRTSLRELRGNKLERH